MSRLVFLAAFVAFVSIALADPVAHNCAVADDPEPEATATAAAATPTSEPELETGSRMGTGKCVASHDFEISTGDEMWQEVQGGHMTFSEASAWFNFVMDMTPGYTHDVTGDQFKCPTSPSKKQANKTRFMMRKWSDVQPSCREISRGEVTANETSHPGCGSAPGYITNEFNDGTRLDIFKVKPDGKEKLFARGLQPGEGLTLPCRSTLYVARTSKSGACVDALGLWQPAMEFRLNGYYFM